MTDPIVITRREAIWQGPQPEPSLFDGYLYRAEFGTHNIGGYPMSWVEGTVRSRAPEGAVVVHGWSE